MDRSKVRLALLILADRISTASFGWQEWDLLGYDSYKFRGLGYPSDGDLKEKAVEIVLDAIEASRPTTRDDLSY